MASDNNGGCTQNWELAARHIAKVANGPKIVIEKSTLPVRTAHSMKKVLEANDNGLLRFLVSYQMCCLSRPFALLVLFAGTKFQILSNPEFLAEGTAVTDLQKPDRVLIGGGLDEAGQKAVNKHELETRPGVVKRRRTTSHSRRTLTSHPYSTYAVF